MKTCEGKLGLVAMAMFCIVWLFACGREDAGWRVPIDGGADVVLDEADERNDAQMVVDASEERDASLPVSSDAASLEPTAHLPGTLLRDTAGGFWMVGRWLDRSQVTMGDMLHMHLEPAMAISMSLAEERCLPDSGRTWHPPQLWRLYRFPGGTLWYINMLRQFRRRATPEAIASWHDDPGEAIYWSASLETWLSDYRNLGPMFLMEGTLLQTESGWYLVYDNATHRFESEALLRQAGYHPDRAIRVSQESLWNYGSNGSEIRAAAFALCPSARPDPHRYDDEDGDGAWAEVDCNDRNPNQRPGLTELCDGVDNNCDGVIDDGFHVGFECHMDDDCQTLGMTECGYDGWSVSCVTDETGCE